MQKTRSIVTSAVGFVHVQAIMVPNFLCMECAKRTLFAGLDGGAQDANASVKGKSSFPWQRTRYISILFSLELLTFAVR
mgnify:CR=1 FL=1